MMLLKEFLKNRSEIGSIAPSSPFLIRKMLKPINFSKKLTIVEFGPGTGALTNHILKRLNNQSTLIAIESNDRLYQQIRSKKNLPSNVKIVHDSAEHIDSVLREMNIQHVDYIISSLPLAIIPEPEKKAIVKNASRVLSDTGLYIQYQYSLDSRSLLASVFGKVSYGFSIMNIPPAFIYYCKK